MHRARRFRFLWILGTQALAWGIGAAATADDATADNVKAPVDQGRQHWAFRKLVRPIPPPVKAHDRVRAPIDSFIVAQLEEHGLSFSPDTDRVRLVRRAYFDLVGLPPSPQAVDRFLNDERPDAFERLVDGLLASPRFGVRWGRHWLDIVGYTDTISFDDDYNAPIGFLSGKWRYRDYVVDSFNADKPYNQFLTEQLAGDELTEWRTAERLTPQMAEQLVATGFFRCCEDISLEDPRPFIIWSVLHDTVEQIGTSVLGLSLRCCRCHDHKFEPIPQSDYYGLMALVTPAFNPEAWKNPQQRALPDISAKELAALNEHNAEIDRKAAEVAQAIASLRRPYELKLREEKLAALPEPIRDDVRLAVDAAADQRNEIQKYLAEKFEAVLAIKPEAVDAAISTTDKQAIDAHQQRISELNGQKRSHGWIQAVYDVGPPPATHLLSRGDYLTPANEIRPGFLRVLASERDAALLGEKPPGDSSGRRLAFARWLTEQDSPAAGLVTRVMVNRVWQHLLGEGIARSTDNVGSSGVPPTHPELIDWLAADFVEHGWHVKRMIRQIVTSTVYRQASQPGPPAAGSADPQSVDPDNRLLWRARLRRLEAESVRDAMLSAAGKLDETQGGEPVPLEYQPNGTILVASANLPAPTSRWRRTMYLLNRRIYNPSFLSVFDKPIVTGSLCVRDDAPVALQSLAMMNDPFVLEQAGWLAERVVREAGDSPQIRIAHAFRLALGRHPSEVELQGCVELLDAQVRNYADATAPADVTQRKALAELCQVLFGMSEFLYLE